MTLDEMLWQMYGKVGSASVTEETNLLPSLKKREEVVVDIS